jgi:hypothetical protein
VQHDGWADRYAYMGERAPYELMREVTMCKLQRIWNMAVVALLLGVAGVFAGELPQYEVGGLSVSPHQISVLGLGGIQQQSPTPTLTLNGMPASPHQIAVLQPRIKCQSAFNRDPAYCLT